MLRPGQYSLLFMMPAISRSFYLTLAPSDQKRVIAEACREIRNTVDIDRLASWTWSSDRVETDDDGFKPEQEVREEIAEFLEDLGRGGNVITISDPGLPAELGGDKRIDCGASYHFAYALSIARRAKPPAPWILSSHHHPQIVFEMRAALEWIGVPLPYEMTPFTGKPSKVRRPVTKVERRKLRRRRRRTAAP